MKKVIWLLMLIFVLNFSYSYAAGLTSNASPVVVAVNGTTRQEITFPAPTRNLYINNPSTGSGIWVNLKGGDNEAYSNTAGRIYISGADSLELYDFMTEAITIFSDSIYEGSTSIASPVTVLATY